MEPLRRSEFWEDTIKKAARESARMKVQLHYRPIGFLVVVSILVFLQLSDMGVSLPVATLLTILAALLTIMFS